MLKEVDDVKESRELYGAIILLMGSTSRIIGSVE
jgi:hypothetical protein